MNKVLVLFFLVFLTFTIEGKQKIPKELKKKHKQGCIWLFKRYKTQNQQQIDAKMSELSKSEKKQFIDRLILKAVQNCQNLYNDQSSITTFVDTYRQKRDIYTFQLLNHIERSTIDYEEQYTKQQKEIIQMSKPIFEAKQEEQTFIVFGYDLKKLPKSAKYYYLTGYTAVIIFALYHGLKQIQPPKNKRE